MRIAIPRSLCCVLMVCAGFGLASCSMLESPQYTQALPPSAVEYETTDTDMETGFASAPKQRDNPVMPATGLMPRSSQTAPTDPAVGLTQHTRTEIGGDFDPALSPDQRLLAFASTRHHPAADIYLKAVGGFSMTQLTRDAGWDIQPSFSPDGRTVAFASNRAGSFDIWMLSLGGGGPVRVTDDPADEYHPTWSPDGSRLAFCRDGGNGTEWELWLVEAKARGARQLIGPGLLPEWSPNGEYIAFQRPRDRDGQLYSLWTVSVASGEPGYPTEVAGDSRSAFTSPSWSADGAWIAFSEVLVPGSDLAASRPAVASIGIVRADGSDRRSLTNGSTGDYSPAFSGNGRIFFVSDRSGKETIWSVQTPGYSPTATARQDAEGEEEPAADS